MTYEVVVVEGDRIVMRTVEPMELEDAQHVRDEWQRRQLARGKTLVESRVALWPCNKPVFNVEGWTNGK
jgi:2-keto-4-pentenoate hydratase